MVRKFRTILIWVVEFYLKQKGIFDYFSAITTCEEVKNLKPNPEVYLKTAEEDEICKPTYWSEMDSYHLANIFSLYCAGMLLQDPGMGSGALLKEVATAVVGSEYADKLYSVLTLIEDARTGDSFESFKWSMDRDNDSYILTSSAYDAAGIHSRACEALGYLNEMIDADLSCNTISSARLRIEFIS